MKFLIGTTKVCGKQVWIVYEKHNYTLHLLMKVYTSAQSQMSGKDHNDPIIISKICWETETVGLFSKLIHFRTCNESLGSNPLLSQFIHSYLPELNIINK